MNFRDRLVQKHAEEQQHEERIVFNFYNWEADVDVWCMRGNIVGLLYNLIWVAKKLWDKIELTDEEKQKIVKQWKREIKDFIK
jgi:hypothetical protein